MPRPATDDVFRAIADPIRRELLDRLRSGSQPVSKLASSFHVTLPAISQHLRVLKDVGLVREERSGRQRFYRVNPGALREVSDWVSHYQRFWSRKLDALERHLRSKP